MSGNKISWVFYDSLSKNQSAPISTEDAQIAIFKIRPQDMQRFFIWTTGWQNWQPLKSYLESDQKNFVSTFTLPKTLEETVRATIKDITEHTHTNFHSKREDSVSQSFSSIRLNEETMSRIIRQEVNANSKNFDGDELTWSNIKKSTIDFSKVGQGGKPNPALDKREARHELKIEVFLISPKGKTFRSRSKNISLSGSLLEDTIPFDFYDSPFDVLIINNHTKDPQKSRVKFQATIVNGSGGLTQRLHFKNPTDLQKKSLQALLEEYIQLQRKAARAG